MACNRLSRERQKAMFARMGVSGTAKRTPSRKKNYVLTSNVDGVPYFASLRPATSKDWENCLRIGNEAAGLSPRRGSISYEEAMERMAVAQAELFAQRKASKSRTPSPNLFDLSVIAAEMFDVSKEEAMNNLIHYTPMDNKRTPFMKKVKGDTKEGDDRISPLSIDVLGRLRTSPRVLAGVPTFVYCNPNVKMAKKPNYDNSDNADTQPRVRLDGDWSSFGRKGFGEMVTFAEMNELIKKKNVGFGEPSPRVVKGMKERYIVVGQGNHGPDWGLYDVETRMNLPYSFVPNKRDAQAHADELNKRGDTSPRAVEPILSDDEAWEVLLGMKESYRKSGLSHTSFSDDVRTTFRSNPELLGRVMRNKGFASADSFYVEGTIDGRGYKFPLDSAKGDKASPLKISSRLGGCPVPVDFAGEKPYYDEYAKRSLNVVPSKAFYDHDEHRIFFNDDAVDDVDSGKDEAYTLRHEYGHHILKTTNEAYADAYATYGDEFLRGIDIEKKAHKCDMDKAAETALTHLKEDDNFYDKLIRVKL